MPQRTLLSPALCGLLFSLAPLLAAEERLTPSGAFQRGIERHNSGEYAEAITAFRTALEGNYNPPGTMFRLARAYARQGQTEEAFAWLEKAVAAGFASNGPMRTDADLAPLRADSRFAALALRVDQQSRPCETRAEYKQFDFWIGDWAVTSAGQPAGENRIERVNGGCVLVEHWTSPSLSGKSWNYYTASTGQWKQVWVDERGTVTEFTGGWRDGVMQFETNGNPKRRLTFTPRADGSVRQLGEHAEGSAWVTDYDLLYRRK